MIATLVSIGAIYIFILLGYFAKYFFKEKIHDKTLVIFSVYIFQPFLALWGILQKPIDFDLAMAPVLFFTISLGIIFFNTLLAKKLFQSLQDRSIFTVASVIGNTGNLGVPLGIAIFGEASVPYTTLINLANVIIVYTFGVYFYSRGNFSVKDSILNIIKLPVLWFTLLAIILNLLHYQPSPSIDKSLQMGAYTSMVVQLLIFGIYLYSVHLKAIDAKLIGSIALIKFVFIPLIAFLILSSLSIEPFTKAVLFMELMMPLAVANVNLAALYECKPTQVTAAVFVTSLLFLLLIFFYLPLLHHLWQQ
ncbi:MULTISPECIES: AEC family transporter [unclassified Nitratiruptor]|uniref:AEC family transporter n=1 Tax=unclassified Nitratiruptor TaxID=2624044 RepID=UPI0019169A15|nr:MULTISPECIES: AEC family transporter [unclassified Nitratiruptor]BCD60633.1 hypothetical protein NitYY0810_C1408 [Nitratiruptor sp. YY08-10]BCD64564.1 hypothetical protein NitYY0814_C1415 [Nitratiruptor sp. YY08-14]